MNTTMDWLGWDCEALWESEKPYIYRVTPNSTDAKEVKENFYPKEVVKVQQEIFWIESKSLFIFVNFVINLMTMSYLLNDVKVWNSIFIVLWHWYKAGYLGQISIDPTQQI